MWQVRIRIVNQGVTRRYVARFELIGTVRVILFFYLFILSSFAVYRLVSLTPRHRVSSYGLYPSASSRAADTVTRRSTFVAPSSPRPRRLSSGCWILYEPNRVLACRGLVNVLSLWCLRRILVFAVTRKRISFFGTTRQSISHAPETERTETKRRAGLVSPVCENRI